MITTVSSALKNFVLGTAEYLYKELGWEITLICDTDEEFSNTLPDYLKYIPVPMSRGVNFKDLKSIKKLKKIFYEEKFDIVQYSTPNAAFYASIAARFSKIPIRLYGQWGIRYVGFKGIKRHVFKFLEKIACQNSTHIFAVSKLNMQFAVSEKLYRKEKVQIVGNGGTMGVDLDKYLLDNKFLFRDKIREKYGILKTDFVYGFAGRISSDKGCKELFTAFRNISQIHTDVKLLIVGPIENEDNIDIEILSWIKNSKKVFFTGRVNNENMREYYSAMDVLVHPTYREGFGMVIQEAGALAVPVITTKIPGASEVMEENISCILVKPKEVYELENAMLKIKNNPEFLKKLGEEAYKRTVALYDRKIMLENQKNAYKKILGD